MKLHPVELERLTPEILHVFGRQPPLLTAAVSYTHLTLPTNSRV